MIQNVILSQFHLTHKQSQHNQTSCDPRISPYVDRCDVGIFRALTPTVRPLLFTCMMSVLSFEYQRKLLITVILAFVYVRIPLVYISNINTYTVIGFLILFSVSWNIFVYIPSMWYLDNFHQVYYLFEYSNTYRSHWTSKCIFSKYKKDHQPSNGSYYLPVSCMYACMICT